MATLLLICTPHGNAAPIGRSDADRLAAHLAADGVAPSATILETTAGGVRAAVLQPSRAVLVREHGVAFGLCGADEGWDRIGSPVPDAVHALARWDDDDLELCADLVGSRTLWYVQTPDVFVASTSQRAMVAALRSYQPNTAARTWMLASGNLGPDASWDLRIRRLGAGGTARLRRSTWSLEVQRASVQFAAESRDVASLGRELDDTIRTSVGRLSIDHGIWEFPISGGSDSRAVATSIAEPAGLRSLSWGAPGSESDPHGDAAVARAVAEAVGFAHRFVPLDPADTTPEQVLDRFVLASEGRTDHIAGYLDGLALWRGLADSGVLGIIRGDQAFGWTENHTDSGVRRSMEAVLLEELEDVKWAEPHITEAWGAQEWPEHLHRREDETRVGWRDRLYHQHRMPVVLAPLSDIKASFVEIANPLLARSIIEVARRVPDAERTRKRLYRSVIQARMPDIPYSSRSSDPDADAYLAASATRDRLLEVISDPQTGGLVPAPVVRGLVDRLTVNDMSPATRSIAKRGSAAALAKRLVPLGLKRRVAGRVGMPARVSTERLAARLYTIALMDRTLRDDAAILAGHPG